MRRFSLEGRRARLGNRHHLAPGARASSPLEVAADLVGLHATDPATVYLAAAARLADPTRSAIERDLYEERNLVRMLGMRRTMFVVPVELAGVIQAAATRPLAAQERARTVGLLTQAGVEGDAARWLEDVEAATAELLAEMGEATAAELARAEPRLSQQIVLAPGKPYEARPAVVSRVLLQMGVDGRVVRGRPLGSWISSQYRWSLLETWLGRPLPAWELPAAQVELVRRWLGAFGPGTVADIRWWTGWSLTAVKRALAGVRPVEVAVYGREHLVLPGDDEPEPPAEPWVALLPALDPTVMGWSERAWYLGPHAPALFDRNGNGGPSIWSDGRIVGGWSQRPDGEVVTRLLEEVGIEKVAAIEAEAARLTGWLEGVRVTPRFRTPLEKELAG